MDFIFMLTRNDRTIEDAADVVDAACDLGVRHIGFKDVGVPFATMQELARTIRRRGGVCYLEVVSTTAKPCSGRSKSGGRSASTASSAAPISTRRRHPGRPVALFSVSRPPGRPSDAARRIGGARRRALPARAGDGLRRRGPARLPRDRGRPARPRPRGARRAAGARLIVAGSVNSANGSTRSPPPASMPSPSARRCSTARSPRPRDRFAARSSTSSTPATGPRDRRVTGGPPAARAP